LFKKETERVLTQNLYSQNIATHGHMFAPYCEKMM